MLHVIGQRGGAASRKEILQVATRREFEAAKAKGLVVRVGHGRWAVPGIDQATEAAARLNGAVSHRSAALLNGWATRVSPSRPEIIVPRHRKVAAERREGVHLRWRELSRTELAVRVTTEVRTVVDCARDLPFEEALVIADSAMRAGDVSWRQIRDALATLPRTGRAQAELVLRNASGEAANAFESTLRALSIRAVGPIFTPQVRLNLAGEWVRPDLLSRDLRLVVEADSWEFHTEKHQIARDCWRYDEFVLAGWLVLRFSWQQVMFRPEWVMSVISRAVCQQRERLRPQ